jgi:hypothetical protein
LRGLGRLVRRLVSVLRMVVGIFGCGLMVLGGWLRDGYWSVVVLS